LKQYGLRKFSGPFDYLFIDFETTLKVIRNGFDDFLHDIILFNKNENRITLYYPKNTNEIDSKINGLMTEQLIGYMRFNYNPVNLFINQNYLRDRLLCGNLYHWDKICIFNHHDLTDNEIYSKLKLRCDRFQDIINNFSSNSILFYITRIIENENIHNHMNNVLSLKEQYEIHSYMVMIICSDTDKEFHILKNNCLFIIKKVEPYLEQFEKYEYDSDLNDINYDNEINIIREYFDFQLEEKPLIS
jgi:hypothetical protein